MRASEVHAALAALASGCNATVHKKGFAAVSAPTNSLPLLRHPKNGRPRLTGDVGQFAYASASSTRLSDPNGAVQKHMM